MNTYPRRGLLGLSRTIAGSGNAGSRRPGLGLPVASIPKPALQPRGLGLSVASIPKPALQPRGLGLPVASIPKPALQPRGLGLPVASIPKPALQPRGLGLPVASIPKPALQLRGLGLSVASIPKPALQPRGLFGLGRILADVAERDRRKLVAWNRAALVPGRDRNELRRDDYGLYIRFSDYGDRDSEFGWEIDHIVPLARGGLDIDRNLRALHWHVNASRGI